MPELIKELLLTLALTGIILYIHDDWYDNCIANAASVLKYLNPSLDCYDVYDSIVQSESKPYKSVLISAAVHVMFTIIGFALTLFSIIHVCTSNTPEELIARWCTSIVVALTVLAVIITSEAIFYRCCKKAALRMYGG